MHTLNVLETKFSTKIDGEVLIFDYALMHPTWINAFLRKAAQRLVNDTYSGEKENKLALARLMIKDIHSGEPMTEKAKGELKRVENPAEALAIKNAKIALMVRFENAMPEVKKMAEYAKHAKIAPYFKITDKGAVWIESQVQAWIATQLVAGKDFLQEAKNTLAIPVGEVLDF